MLKLRHIIRPIINFPILIMLSACHNQPSSPSTDFAHISASTGDTAASTPVDTRKTIIFFGNSLTAGYGLDAGQSFPTLIGQRLDSLHLPYRVINAGVSGETSAGGKSRIDWTLRQPADIFVLELGANDGLRGIPVNSTRDNLQAIIDTVHYHYPNCKIILAGMHVPPNMGSTYSTAFYNIFTELSKKNNLTLIPFILDGVGGDPSLNQADGIHPNTKGEKIVTETVWKSLQPLL